MRKPLNAVPVGVGQIPSELVVLVEADVVEVELVVPGTPVVIVDTVELELVDDVDARDEVEVVLLLSVTVLVVVPIMLVVELVIPPLLPLLPLLPLFMDDMVLLEVLMEELDMLEAVIEVGLEYVALDV